METPKEYYYTYYSYEEWGRGYVGSRKCYCSPEEDIKYLGSSSDKTFKPTQKIILKDDYVTREEAYDDEIILQQYYKVVENPHFSNRAYQTSTKFYVPTEQAKENGKKVGFLHKENGTGIFSRTKEQMIEQGKKLGKLTYELGIGIYSLTPDERIEACKIGGENAYKLGVGVHGLTPEQKTANGKKGGTIGGKKSYEMKLGIHAHTPEEKIQIARIGGKVGGKKSYEMKVGVHALTKEQRIENGKKAGKIGGQKNKENKTGICGLTKEQRSETTKKTNSQKWKCTETGYITNAGALTQYQRARGIDTSKRIKL